MSTIFAPASGAGAAAIAILRMSGPATASVLKSLAGQMPAARHATLRRLRAPDGALLDRAVVLWLPGPASYTGEDCAELHIHGGRAVMAAVTGALLMAGIRPAEPGEFTKRAFLNGKMDLLEAEGIADLVAAQTETQRRQALAQLAGAQTSLLAGWAETLRRALAWQEALIDFPDEDLPREAEAALLNDIADLGTRLSSAAALARHGARVRDGLVITVIGPPNVGKSSLVNRLADRDVAITSPFPGTTRDTLETWMDIAGVPVTLIDTAGLRTTDDPVEAEGVRRAIARAERADLVLHIADAGVGPFPDFDAQILGVANKIDLAPAPAGWIGVSALTGTGIAELRTILDERVRALTDGGASPLLSRARHEAALLEAASCLHAALDAHLPELRGEELRLAMRALGRITGTVGVEDILDTVFGAFCIGK